MRMRALAFLLPRTLSSIDTIEPITVTECPLQSQFEGMRSPSRTKRGTKRAFHFLIF